MKIGTYLGAVKYLATADTQYARLRELGYDTLHERAEDTRMPLYRDSRELEAFCRERRQAAMHHGIEISQLHGPWPTDDTSEESRRQGMAYMRTAVLACHLLECRHLILHPVMPYGRAKDEDADTAEEMTARRLEDLLADCERYGVILCLENMPFRGQRISPPARIASLVCRIQSPNLGICLDTGHANVLGVDAGDAVRCCAENLRVLHVHDNNGNTDAHMLPFTGTVNWTSFTSALAEIGFAGSLDLECTGPVSGHMPKDLRKQGESLTYLTARRLSDMVEAARVKTNA